MPRRGIRRFLRLPRSAARVRADIDDELRFDIEMRARDLERAGLPPDAAHARAAAEFGDLEFTRRYCEELDMRIEGAARRANYVEDLASDLAIAWRGMRRSPLFAFVVVATLALGIGANTAVFSVVRRVLIAPLPYRAPEQLYRLYTQPTTADGDDDKLSLVELSALAAQSHTLAGVTESGSYQSVTYNDGRIAEPWHVAYAALNFFDVLGVHPVVGREFNDGDLMNGAPRVAVIGYDLWQRDFGGNARAVGRHVQLDNVDCTVVGVLPAGFVMPEPGFGAVDALEPLNVAGILQFAPRMARGRGWRGIARLRTGVSRAALDAELSVIRRRIQADNPDMKGAAGVVRPVPLHAAMVGTAGTVLVLVMVAALLVLVIACVNIGGLFLARAAARRRELGLRAALGAGRSRLVRQVLTESCVYGAAGGIAGVAVAVALKRAFLALAGSTLPQLGDIRIDGGVLAFAAAASILCGLAFGFAPAFTATRLDLRDALGEANGHGASQGRVRVRGSRLMAAAQMAIALVLLVGAGLLLRTFVALISTNLGYRAESSELTFHVNLPYARFRDDAQRVALRDALAARIHAMPRVTAVGYTAVTPWNGGMMSVGLRVEGRPTAGPVAPDLQYATASDEFFTAIGIPLRAGRAFTPSDRPESPRVVVISESVARRYWPNQSPLGARVRLDDGGNPDSAAVLEVVGVVGDVRPSVTADPIGTVYVPERQWIGYGGEWVVRASGDASRLIPGVRQALHELDPKLPLLFPRTIRAVLHKAVARQQLAMALMGAFAALALLLAALGIYSVMAYGVAARTRELGIRTALGAQRASILMLVLRQGLATTAIGVAAGTALALLASRYVASLLTGVSSHDPLTFVAAPAVLALVALAACLVPARRATRIEPVEALRVE